MVMILVWKLSRLHVTKTLDWPVLLTATVNILRMPTSTLNVRGWSAVPPGVPPLLLQSNKSRGHPGSAGLVPKPAHASYTYDFNFIIQLNYHTKWKTISMKRKRIAIFILKKSKPNALEWLDKYKLLPKLQKNYMWERWQNTWIKEGSTVRIFASILQCFPSL